MDRQFMQKKTHTFFQKGIPFLEMIGTLMEEVCLLQRKTTILIQPPQNYKEPVKSSGAKWKSIHLCSYYHPKTSNEESNHQLAKSLETASSIKNSFVVVAGDFNLPQWGWKNNRLKPNTPYPSIHHKFTDISDDNGFIQRVEEPTRGINTLDLIETNHPSSFRTEIISGVSDHDIFYTETDIVPTRQ